MTNITKAPAKGAPHSGKEQKLHFLLHDPADHVAVAVVDIQAGTKVRGRALTETKMIEVDAQMDIPLGHKIALRDFQTGETVLKYGWDIGRTIADIKKGEHVHVHNLKTKRW